jgi:Uncharacterized protein conserved in bacteria (DUF2171)
MNENPVSWLMIEQGWKVVDSAGAEVGQVEEVVGDTGVDIFNGLSVSISLLGGPRYVPAEDIRAITEGQVQLELSHDEVKRLRPYEEPPPSEEILPPDRE